MKVKDLPYFSQPIYKFKCYGSHFLSESELLALIIGFGCKGKNVLELSNEIFNLLFEVGYEHVTLEDLMKIKGVSEKKAIKVKAIIELVRRLSHHNSEKIILKDEDAIFKWALSRFSGLDREIFIGIFVSAEYHLQGIRLLASGGEDEVEIHLKNFLKDLLLGPSSRVILLHNHLEGKPEVSPEDIETNTILTERAKSVGIEIIKHIVIGKHGYQLVPTSSK